MRERFDEYYDASQSDIEALGQEVASLRQELEEAKRAQEILDGTRSNWTKAQWRQLAGLAAASKDKAEAELEEAKRASLERLEEGAWAYAEKYAEVKNLQARIEEAKRLIVSQNEAAKTVSDVHARQMADEIVENEKLRAALEKVMNHHWHAVGCGCGHSDCLEAQEALIKYRESKP